MVRALSGRRCDLVVGGIEFPARAGIGRGSDGGQAEPGEPVTHARSLQVPELTRELSGVKGQHVSESARAMPGAP